MSKGFSYLVIIALLLVSSAITAAPILKIDGQRLSDTQLLGYIDIYEDINRSHTIESIMRPEQSAMFAPANLNELYFGYTSSAYWLRLSLQNDSDKLRQMMLQSSPAEIDLLEMYLVNMDSGQVVRQERTGSAVPFEQRPYAVESLLFDFYMQPNSSYTIYLRASSNKSVNFRLSFATQQNFLSDYTTQSNLNSGVITLLLTIAALALWLGWMLKQRALLFLAGYIFCTSMVQLGISGHIMRWLPALPWVLDSYLHVYTSSMNIFICLVTAQLFTCNVEKTISRRVLYSLIGLNSLAILAAFTLSSSNSAKFCALITLISIAAAFLIVLQAHLQSKPLASPFLLTRTITFIVMMVAIFNAKGYLPISFITEWGMAIAAAFEGILICICIVRYKLRHHLKQIETLSNANSAIVPSTLHHIYLTDICHELRTPISGIMGMTELLMGTQLSEQQRSQLNIVNDSTLSLLDITHKIDALGTLQQGMVEVESSSVNIGSLIEEIIKSLQIRLQQRNIEVILHIAPQLHSPVLTDIEKLRLILSTALQLSIRHIENGELILSAQPHNNIVEFSISASNNYGEAYRTDQPTYMTSTDKFNLTILESHVKVLGGQLFNNSQANQIALSFSVAVKSDSKTNAGQDDARLQKILVGKRILVTDDNATCCTIIEKQATSWGMIVHTASSGKETLAKLNTIKGLNEHFDILLIDYDMPNLNGLETIRRIAESATDQPSHIFLLTGMNKTVAAQAVDLPITKILFKPINGNALKQHLIEALKS